MKNGGPPRCQTGPMTSPDESFVVVDLNLFLIFSCLLYACKTIDLDTFPGGDCILYFCVVFFCVGEFARPKFCCHIKTLKKYHCYSPTDTSGQTWLL